VRDGGTLIEACPVKHVEPGPLVLVTCADQRQFSADSIVLCLGPWSGAFLATMLDLHLPLKARNSQ
jgi:glycine/D-amino acid oxidase-like deaminating enzyme